MNKGKNNFELRYYQIEAKREIINLVKNHVRGKINSELEKKLDSGNLLEVATGAGKTLITGDTLGYLI